VSLRNQMLFDPCGRPITYLRISVTDRCNFRCTYCMPQGGVKLKGHNEILRLEQIVAISQAAVTLGITKIRLTGGEPLVRRGIVDLVAGIGAIEGLGELCMTTNGSQLSPLLARELKGAGLDRITISLDTLDPAHFEQLTRGGKLAEVLAGVDAALEADLNPVKINMVLFDTTTQADISAMRSFCEQKGVLLQTIAHFNLDQREHNHRVPADRPGACTKCNRIRLTADGYLKPCLYSDSEIKVDFADLEGSLKSAVAGKPVNGTTCTSRSMNQIGG